MNKPFLILQLRPENEASDSEFRAFLKYGGLKLNEVKRIRVEQSPLPNLNLNEYSGIIVGGSPFDISTTEKEKSELQKRIENDFQKLLKPVIKNDIPFLGACSGSSLLGSYCGTRISDKYKESVGGTDIVLTKKGKKDQLLVGLPETFRVLVGHKEACDYTPTGATLLASSKTCPVQMFRLGNNVYATQFHPEADPAGFKTRINIYKNHGYFTPDEAKRLISMVAQEKTPVAQEMLRRFVKKFRTTLLKP